MLYNLERVTCIHLLKIVSDSNFNLLFLEKLLAFSKLASAKFDPCCLSVSCTKINHSCYTLVIRSSLQLTSKQ